MENRTELERLAEIKVRNARTALILTRPFYGVLLSQTTPKASWQFPTMATDGVTHYYNPSFIVSLTVPETVGVNAHESDHDANHHSTRRGNRNPKRWNEACDYAINGHLILEGFTLPKGALIRDDLTGLSAEEIYRILENEEQAKRQQEQQKQQSEDDESEESEGEGKGKGEGQSDETDGDDTGDEAGDKDDGESDDDADEDDGDGKGKGDDADDGNGDDADDGDGQGDEAGDGDEADGEGEGEASDGEATGNGSGKPEPKSVCGDTGNCGEVLDAPGSEAEKADIDTKWEVTTRMAVAMAKKRGDLPGYWANIIEKRKTPTQDWRSILREYIDAGARTVQTWNRPNRRFVHGGLILPGNKRDGINKVCFIIDASGSMSGQHVKIANELQAALDNGSISEAVFIYCDTEVYHVDTFLDGDVIELAPIRLGGTNMRPAFDLIEQEHDDTSLIICLSDLAVGDTGHEPVQPVLWMAYGSPKEIKMWGDQFIKWGRIIDMDATED